MEEVGVRELRNGLSKHLARVKQGEILTITDHGKPVAQIVPFEPPFTRHTLDELVAMGRVTPARRPKQLSREPIKAGGTVSDLVIEMRR